MGAALASLRAVSTKLVVFDTSVVDLTGQLADPVDLLFAVQLGGGTDINRAVAYGQSLVTRPADTIMVLISDLIEGGDQSALVRRTSSIVDFVAFVRRLGQLYTRSDRQRYTVHWHELRCRQA